MKRVVVLAICSCTVLFACKREPPKAAVQAIDLSKVHFPNEQQAYLSRNGVVTMTTVHPSLRRPGLYSRHIGFDSFNSSGHVVLSSGYGWRRSMGYSRDAMTYQYLADCGASDTLFYRYQTLAPNELLCTGGFFISEKLTGKRHFKAEFISVILLDDAQRVTSETTIVYDTGLRALDVTGRRNYWYSSTGLLLREEAHAFHNKHSSTYLAQKSFYTPDTLVVNTFFYHNGLPDSSVKQTFYDGPKLPEFIRRYADSTGLYQYAVLQDSIFLYYRYHYKSDKQNSKERAEISDSQLDAWQRNFSQQHPALVNRSRMWIAAHHHELTPHDD